MRRLEILWSTHKRPLLHFVWLLMGLYQISLVASLNLNTRVQEVPVSSLLKELQAECTREGINVKLWFKRPFAGIAYSHGHYETAKCRYINREDQVMGPSGTNFSFTIPINECGTVYYGGHAKLMRDTQMDKNNGNEVYIENTLLIQNDPTIQEAGDFAKTLRCVWQKEIHQPLMASLPFGSIKSKSTINKAQRVRTVPGNFNISANRNHSRFHIKGQIQSVPSHGRREHSRSLLVQDEDEEDSYEDEPKIPVKLMDSRDSHQSFSALPLKAVITSKSDASMIKNSAWKSIAIMILILQIKYKLAGLLLG